MTASEDPPPLTARDTQALLSRLGDVATRVVLVGGQAVNFWAEYYWERIPALAAHAPYASKDIDFCGSRSTVREFARRLAGGRAAFPSPDDATPNVGQVIFFDDQGYERAIDFIGAPFGLRADDVVRESVPMNVLSEDGELTGLMFRVMQPVHCLESRVCNVAGLASQYDTPHGRNQLRAAIVCAREYLLDLLALPPEHKPVRKVLGLNERIASLCTANMHGRTIALQTGIEPFDAVLLDERLGDAFRTHRYPQLKAQVERARRKARESAERAAGIVR